MADRVTENKIRVNAQTQFCSMAAAHAYVLFLRTSMVPTNKQTNKNIGILIRSGNKWGDVVYFLTKQT